MSARLQKHVGVRLRPVVTTEQPARRKLDEAGGAKDEDLRTAVKLIANEGGNVSGTIFGIRSEVTRRQPGLDNPHCNVDLRRVEHDLRGCGESTRHTKQKFKTRLLTIFKYKAALEYLDTEVREANGALSRLENQTGRHGPDASFPVVELVINRTGCRENGA